MRQVSIGRSPCTDLRDGGADGDDDDGDGEGEG